MAAKLTKRNALWIIRKLVLVWLGGCVYNWRGWYGNVKDDKYDNLKGGLRSLHKLNGTVIYSTWLAPSTKATHLTKYEFLKFAYIKL